MKPSNTPENELLAQEFMQYISASYAKRRKRFQFQLQKHGVTNDQGAEDVFTETLVKCHDLISREGLPKGKAFAAYFDRATENNLVQYQMKMDTFAKKHSTFEPVPQESYNPADLYETVLGARKAPALPQYVTQEEAFPDFDADSYASPAQLRQLLTLALFETLPAKYKEVLCLVADGLKYRHIQRVLGLTKGQVKMRILTARKLMRELLEASRYPEDASDFLADQEEGFDW